ncbi:MAG: hypothetical protein FWH41_05255 [Treponema sp.]|nr:hypothetical protein [Treponema sp.]MCL2138920.1 hypothetical protein [Treponema sp.]
MKKLVFFLVIGMLIFSGTAFAQTTQGPNTGSVEGAESAAENFAGGGYVGPLLGILKIEDLANTVPNEFVIVEGFLIQQRVPGNYILADAAEDAAFSVIVHFNPYGWANLDIDASTPVLVFGTVNRSELRIEIEAIRIEIPE